MFANLGEKMLMLCNSQKWCPKHVLRLLIRPISWRQSNEHKSDFLFNDCLHPAEIMFRIYLLEPPHTGSSNGSPDEYPVFA